MTEKIDITSLDALHQVASQLAQMRSHGVIYLHGDLGVGKTALVAAWLKALGYAGIVTSPTYSLVNEYEIAGKTVIHADLYRLAEAEELLYLGVEEWRPETALIFIEWPEKGDGYLPPADIHARLSLDASARTLQWQNAR